MLTHCRSLFALLVLLCLGTLPVLAQQTQGQGTNAPGYQNNLGIPSWAAPSSGTQLQQPVAAQAPAAGTPPDLPDAPLQAPLDGGLAWLALAGFGYGLYRLRRPQYA